MIDRARPWGTAKIIPLVVIDDPKDTEPIMEALLNGGLNVIEIGLRTPAALAALEIAVGANSMIVAAGTVTKSSQVRQVVDAGVKFAISPAWSEPVMNLAAELNLPFIPAVATPAEALRALERGYSHQKIYPADLLGGEKFVRSLGAVLPEISLLPSGGVSEQNLKSFLGEPNVFAVSGSWLTPQSLIRERKFSEITARARVAVELANG